jgi:hypothetical protein
VKWTLQRVDRLKLGATRSIPVDESPMTSSVVLSSFQLPITKLELPCKKTFRFALAQRLGLRLGFLFCLKFEFAIDIVAQNALLKMIMVTD